MDNKLVKIKGNEAVTDTAILAKGSGNQHHAVIQLVRNYKEDLEDFGRVAFEMRSFNTEGGIQKREIALLNEHQATLLLTYMKNTGRVRKFKKALVKAFYQAVDHIRKNEDRNQKSAGEFSAEFITHNGGKKNTNMYFPMAKLVESADKYLEGRAALKALNYFTGMPVEDLLEELEEKREEQERRQAFSNDIDRTVRLFLQHECRFAPEYRTAKTDLYDAYCLFCRDNSMRPLARAAFFRQVYAAAGATGGCYLKTVRPRRNNPGRHGYVNGIKTSAV